MRARCCGAVLVLLAACGSSKGVSTHPHVIVDSSIGADLSEFIEGLHAWDSAGVSPEIVLEDHEQVLQDVRTPADDTAYFVALVDPFTQGYGDGTTVQGDRSITWVDVVYLRRYPNFRRAAAHEFGHAMGLAHDEGAYSIMLYSYMGSTTPSSEDLAELRAR